MHRCRSSMRRILPERLDVSKPALCSISRTASETGLSRLTIERLIDAGQLQSITVGCRRLVPRDVVEALAQGHIGTIQGPFQPTEKAA
jgi:excisionase family DNA binding protein